MGRRLGVVLGGGGVRGLAHAGVLATLDREGLAPHVLVGVSMGAAIAAAYAIRTDWTEALKSVDRRNLPAFADMREDEGLNLLLSALRNARRLAPSVWSWSRQGFEELGRTTLKQILGEDATFADTRVPLAVVATDLHAGTRVVLTEGNLVDATLASSAIPGIARPVERNGRTLIDGGFADPAPVDVARTLGADVVVGVYTGQHHEPADTDGWLPALLRGLEIGQRAFAKERLSHADIVLRPDFGERVNVLNFSVADEVVRCGAACVGASVDAIRTALQGESSRR